MRLLVESADTPPRRERGTDLGDDEATGRGRSRIVPQRFGVVAADLVDQQLDEGAAIPERERRSARISLTSSATGPVALTRRLFEARDFGRAARVTAPSRARRSSSSS
jgi:hypothetical protein